MNKKITIISILILTTATAGYFAFAKYKSKQTRTPNPSIESLKNSQIGIDENQQKQEIPKEQENVNEDAAPVQNTVQSDGLKSKTENVQPKITEEEKKESDGKIVSRLISWGYEKANNRKISSIIVHSSYNALGGDPYDVDKIFQEYKQYGVSAHYLIARDGTIYNLVEEKNIAYHAGVSKLPDGNTNVNAVSVGIEMVNTLDGKYTNDQYQSLNDLISSIKKKYSIKYILGHDDIAPGRKTDPWGIDWSKVQK